LHRLSTRPIVNNKAKAGILLFNQEVTVKPYTVQVGLWAACVRAHITLTVK